MPRILWAALLASTFVYAGILLSGTLPGGGDPILRWPLLGVAMVCAVLSFALTAVLRRAAAPIDAPKREEVVPDGEALFRDAAPTQKVVTDPETVRREYVTRRYTSFIVSLAVSEVPAVLGLVSWMAAATPLASCLVLVALSAALMLVRFPSENRWRGDAEARVGAVIP